MYWVHLFLVCFVVYPCVLSSSYDLYEGGIQPKHHIVERALLFPQFTVLQFTWGVSAPAILPNQSINLSMCFQQNYEPPFNLTQLYPTILFARESGVFDLDRTTLYKYISNFLNGYGLEGESCLLRAICEIAEVPMHVEGSNNLFEKLTHYIFTPSIDISTENSTNIVKTSPNVTFSEKLLLAEAIGSKDGNCEQTFSKCGFSLVDLFTKKYKLL